MSALTLGKVVGANVRRIRTEQEATLEDLSRAVRGLGYEWSISRVTAIQRGNRDPQLGTLVLLATVLNCGLGDLLQTDAQWVDLGNVTVSAEGLREMLAGGPSPTISGPGDELGDDDWAATRGYGNGEHMSQTLGLHVSDVRSRIARFGLVEERTARMLDLDADVLAVLTDRLWSCTLGEMRDLVARGESRHPADVTAELRDRLRREIEGWPREQRRPTAYHDPDPE